ncbi:MAG: hypothetical protein KJ949_01085 [Nanoarchaeota archaeon]|nr:hypothetical protein [Nanoarchaeota archaeon]MBU4308249.1 hypothetical protein [Nanoarchaeota archaeon]
MIFKRKQTTLWDLRGIVKSASRIEYYKHFSKNGPYGCPDEIGYSSECLEIQDNKNFVRIQWQWRGELKEEFLLKDRYLNVIEGIKKRKFYSKSYFYHKERPNEDNTLLIEIASIAREKYLAQKEKNIEGMVK